VWRFGPALRWPVSEGYYAQRAKIVPDASVLANLGDYE